MSNIINMFNRKPKTPAKEPTPVQPSEQLTQEPSPTSQTPPKDPWWFMNTPYSSVISHEEKTLIHNAIAASVPLGYLIQLAEHHPTLTIKEFIIQQMSTKEN
jgi:hypothetical protein